MMEHFKEYLVDAPFVVRTDNNPLAYILTTLMPWGTGDLVHWLEFSLEYQKGVDIGAVDALSWVPVNHDCVTV